MATVLIRNGIVAGALGGMTNARQQGSFTPSDYATIVNAADAIASECIVRNAVLAVPMADADNAQIGQMCQAVALGVCGGFSAVSATATDYLNLANNIVAQAKQCAAKLT